MIIAYFVFFGSLLIFALILSIIFIYIFSDKLDHKVMSVESLLGLPFWFWLVLLIISAQYIWGDNLI